MFKSKKGFSLIELMVVVSIIGLLSTLAVVALGNARQRARDAKRTSDMKQIQTALDLYFAESNGYPKTAVGGTTLGSSPAALQSLSKSAGFATTPSSTLYMGAVPSNPLPGGKPYLYKSKTATGSDCVGASDECVSYTIEFALENGTAEYGAGDHVASQAGLQ